jgi:hypothetical protein
MRSKKILKHTCIICINNRIKPLNMYRTVTLPYRTLDNFSTEEYVTSSVLGQGVFDSPSLTLVIGTNNF